MEEEEEEEEEKDVNCLLIKEIFPFLISEFCLTWKMKGNIQKAYEGNTRPYHTLHTFRGNNQNVAVLPRINCSE
jgi:hypothetical protein